MSVFVDSRTRLLVQGITGRDGAFHAQQMADYGTAVVAGVTPGKAGTRVGTIPVFNTVADAVRAEAPNASLVFVPARFATDAIYEAIDGGIEFIVCVSEGLPTLDVLRIVRYLEGRKCRLLGPNCPGIITPGQAKVGILPATIFRPGNVGVVSRSGTLTYEIVSHVTGAGYGESTCVGIGGDPIIGTNFIDCLAAFQQDPETRAVVMVGEIGGTDEEDASRFVKEHMTKPVIGFIAGLTAPAGKRMGHAGAIIAGGTGTAEEKIKAFQAAGIPVAEEPAQVATLLRRALPA